MPCFMRRLTTTAVATSLLAVSTGAIAAAPAAPRAAAPTASAKPTNPWLALSAMTSTSSTASAAAAQDYDGDGPGFPPIVPLIVILGTIALGVYILTKDDDDEPLGLPISP